MEEMTKEQKRCAWCGADPLYVSYHDKEWGVPVHDDKKLFEMQPSYRQMFPADMAAQKRKLLATLGFTAIAGSLGPDEYVVTARR